MIKLNSTFTSLLPLPVGVVLTVVVIVAVFAVLEIHPETRTINTKVLGKLEVRPNSGWKIRKSETN